MLMKKYLLILLLLGCSKDEYQPTIKSLIGDWRISKIEVRDNKGSHEFNDCSIPGKFIGSLLFMDISFDSDESATLKLKCQHSDFLAYWSLKGDKISFYTGNGTLTGKIVYASSNAMIIQFELDFEPYFYYEK